MFAVFKKELRSYFLNAIGYVYVGVFLAVSAVLCLSTTLMSKTYDTSNYFYYIIMTFIVLIPLLTMKLFSEEKKQKTEQLLLTAPVSTWGIVLGKFLAAYTVFGSVTVFSSLYFLIIGIYGHVKVPLLLGNLLAVLLVGMALIAIGLFISAITENQLSAAIASMATLFALTFLSMLCQHISYYPLRFVFESLSLFYRFQFFTQGIFDFAGLFYYLSISAVFLFLTVRIFDRRRWK